MPWEPALDELLPEERALLARLGPVGLDGVTTRAALAARHGVGSYHGWRDAIALPPTSALGLPLSFSVSAEPAVLDLVPEHAWADHLPVPDARANFAAALAALETVLGPGLRADASNCLHARWDHGAFRIELHAFPPELQGPWPNALHALAPQLVHRATVSFGARSAFAVPDASLRPVAALVAAGTTLGAGVAPAWRSSWPRRHAHRNPAALASAIGPGSILAWRHGGRAGLSDREVSLFFPDEPRARIVAVHGQEERGSAPFAEVRRDGVTLLHASDREAAGRAARVIARAWDVAVTEEEERQ